MADYELNFVGPDARLAIAARVRAETAAESLEAVDTILSAIAALSYAANKIIYSTGADTFALADLTAFARSILDDGDAATARATLGVTIGTNVQAFDATLAALAGVTVAANKLIYATGSDAFSTTDLTAFARSILDDGDAATARATLGIDIGTNVQAYDATLAALAALSIAADKLIYATGVDSFSTTDITSFARTFLDDANAAAARATLGLTLGTQVQAFDATLAALAGVTTAADKLIYATGSDTFSTTDLTSFMRTLLDDANAGAARTTLGLVPGTDVQAYSGVLAYLATASAGTAAAVRTLLSLVPGTDVQAYDAELTALAALTTTVFGRSVLELSNAAALRTLAGLVIGTDVQAYDADLAAISTLTPSNDDFLQRKAGAWTNRSVEQVKTDLGIDEDAGNANLPTVVQTQLRPGDVPERFTVTLTGSAEDAEDADGDVQVTDAQGSVLRIDPGVTIATRERAALITGHRYRVRAAFARQTDPTDPLSDAIRFGVQWLNKNKAAVSQRVISDVAASVEDGRTVVSAVVSDTAGTGIDYTWPATARYAVPFITVFGSEGVTDVDTLEWEDITDYPTTEVVESILEAADTTAANALLTDADRVAAENAAASAGASAGIALGTTTNNPSYKAPVRLTARTHVDISSGPVPVDGQETVAGDSVFLPQQDDPSKNGIYDVPASGAWTRRADADTAAEVVNMAVYALEGSEMGRMYRMVATTTPITLGTTPLYFETHEGGGALENLQAAKGTVVFLGDSNYGGRPGEQTAFYRELGHPTKGRWKHWSIYWMGVSGAKLNTVVNNIASMSKAAPAVNYAVGDSPNFDNNPWRAVNASPTVVRACYGINDFGLGTASRVPGAGGNETDFRENMRIFVAFLLANCPHAHIILDMPPPFAGEDFIQGGNVTEWASDSSDLTVDTGAYEASAAIRKVYLEWVGRHPRVSVIDSAELFGTRIDDPDVDGLDPEESTPTTPLMDDTLHWSDRAGRRRWQRFIARFLGSRHGYATDYGTEDVSSALLDIENLSVWSARFNYRALTNTGGNTSISLHASPMHVLFDGKRAQSWTEAGTVPSHDALQDAELAEKIGNLAQMQQLRRLRGTVKMWFPASDTVHTIYRGLTFSSTTTDAGDQDRFQVYLMTGINLGGVEAASGEVVFWIEDRASLPFIQKQVTRDINPGTAAVASVSIPNPYYESSGEQWPIRRAKINRFASTDGACSFAVSIANQSSDTRYLIQVTSKTGSTIDDGAGGAGTVLTVPNGTSILAGMQVTGTGVSANTYVVSGSGTSWVVSVSQLVAATTLAFGINPGTSYELGTLSFTSSQLVGTWVPNLANIERALVTGIWTVGPSGATFTASISNGSGGSGTSMVVTAVASGTIRIGDYIEAAGVTGGTTITAGPAAGGTGTYTVSASHNVASTTIISGQGFPAFPGGTRLLIVPSITLTKPVAAFFGE